MVINNIHHKSNTLRKHKILYQWYNNNNNNNKKKNRVTCKIYTTNICAFFGRKNLDGKNEKIPELFGPAPGWKSLLARKEIVAPVWVARLLWSLPRQAKPPLYCGWHWIWNKSHWPWNGKSTMWKARSSPTQTWIPLGKLEAIYNFAASILFALHNPCLGPFDTMIAGSCPKVILLVQPRLL